MDAAQKVINSKAQEFLAALSAGKREWTAEEVAAYFLERKKVADKVTVPEHQLGPMDPARSALVARTLAALVGGSMESSRDGFFFAIPEDAKAALPTVVERVVEKVVEKPVIVEKVVEKVVEKKVTVDGQALPEQDDIVFQSQPVERKALAAFQEPAWYKLMAAALNFVDPKTGKPKHVSLAGPPGIGKSTAPEQFFIRKGQPFVIVNGDAGFRRRDIEGTTEVANGRTFFRVADFATAAIKGWGAILNEVNAADADALIWINGILEEGIINVHGRAYPVHPEFRLVVTYNPGLVGTKALPQSFKDRFFSIKLQFPNREFLKKMVVAKTGISPGAQYLDKMLRYAADCWSAHERGNLRYQITPRRLFDAVFLMESGVVGNVYDTQAVELALKHAVVDAVDSAADVQLLTKLITTPGAIPEAGARFGGPKPV